MENAKAEVIKWAILENIVIIITSGLCMYYVSGWCFFMLAMCNRLSLKEKNNGTT